MPTDHPTPLATAAARRSADTRSRATAALRRLDATGTPITFTAVANAAGVSRSWLYRTPDIRAEIERLRRPTGHRSPSRPATPAAHQATAASQQQRIETLLTDIAALRDENRRLRAQVAVHLGQLRAQHPSRQAPNRTIGPCS